jgi:hypothetical protein
MERGSEWGEIYALIQHPVPERTAELSAPIEMTKIFK